MDINWDYEKLKVHVSMLNYIPEALLRFKHKSQRTPQHQPYLHIKSMYGTTKQYPEQDDKLEPASKEEKTYIHEVIGMFLYYS